MGVETGINNIIEDTPQKVVKKGYLVELQNGDNTVLIKVTGFRGNRIKSYNLEYHLSIWVITKIFTLNANGDYIKQWEEEIL